MDKILERQSSVSSFARPQSRRGGIVPMDSSGIGTPVGQLRPTTGLRILTANRPPSAQVRGGTASRLLAASTLMQPPGTANTTNRIGTAIGYAGAMMIDRPLTQHGLSGLPATAATAQTASGNRQVKDKRYWEAIIQSKKSEIKKEIDRLQKESVSMHREQSARKSLEKKVRDSAKDLIELQGKLADMNIVLDNANSGNNRDQILNESTALKQRNEDFQSQLESLFTDRMAKEAEVKQLEENIKSEKNKINEMVASLPESDRLRYKQYQTLNESLKQKNIQIHEEIDVITKRRDHLHGMLMKSQPHLEAVRLKTKQMELTTKRDNLQAEEMQKLSPAQSREKMISEVRNNNQALASINKQIKIAEDQLNEKRELLHQIELDIEEGNSERHAKYKELRRRDEKMSEFMDTFEDNMKAEKQEMERLKSLITFAIEQITLQGINLKSYGITKSMDEHNDLSSHSGLLKEYKQLSMQLKQLQLLETTTMEQFEQSQKEEETLSFDIHKYANVETLRIQATEKMEELTSTIEELNNKERITKNVVSEAKSKYEEIKELLRSNETYKQISHMEEKLSDKIKELQVLQDSVESLHKEYNYSDVKRESLLTVAEIMKLIR